MGENIAHHISEREFISNIYKNSYNSVVKQTWAKDLDRHFSKEDTHMAKKHMKR